MYEKSTRTTLDHKAIKNTRPIPDDLITLRDVKEMASKINVGDFIAFYEITTLSGNITKDSPNSRYGTRELRYGMVTNKYEHIVTLSDGKDYQWKKIIIGEPVRWDNDDYKLHSLFTHTTKFEVNKAITDSKRIIIDKLMEDTGFSFIEDRNTISDMLFKQQFARYLNI